MKGWLKKWLVILLTVVACAFAFTACGTGKDAVAGKYQLEYNGSCTSSCYFELDGKGKVTYFVGKDLWGDDEDFSVSGEYTLDGNKITITITIEGITDSVSGTVKGGVLDLGEMGKFYKNGKIPSSTDNDDNGDEGDEGDENAVDGTYYMVRNGSLLQGCYLALSGSTVTYYVGEELTGGSTINVTGTCTVNGTNISIALTYGGETEIMIGTVQDGTLCLYEEGYEQYKTYFCKEGVTPPQIDDDADDDDDDDENAVDGTYYMVRNGSLLQGCYLALSGSTVTYYVGEELTWGSTINVTGTCTVNGTNISIALTYGGETEIMIGTVQDGTLCLYEEGYEQYKTYFCKEGVTPPQIDDDNN